MTEKKFVNKDIIDAISLKFGSIDEYAEIKKTSTQNIYNKISRQARKFIVELKRDGIIIGEPKAEYSIKKDFNEKEYLILKQEFDLLKAENEDLKKKLVDYSDALLEKDKKIREYEKKPSFRVQSSPNG